MNYKKRILLLSTFLYLCISPNLIGQNLFSGYGHLFTKPLSYVVAKTSTPPVIDGNINDEVWSKASWTEFFQDIEGRNRKPDPRYKTRVKMLWDNDYLYFAVEMEEPHVWANLTERDQIVFYDNDFEIFIDPSNTTHRYFEIEINALNNIFDLFMSKPYRNGGSALFAWDTPNMKHAVHIDGSLNNVNDVDKGWSVEFAVPFSAVTIGNDKHLPADKEVWRLNFSRVEWDTDIVNGKYVKQKDENGKVKPENNWVWSPQGVINMHLPERWGYLQFSTDEAGVLKNDKFEKPYFEYRKDYLWLVYYKQKDYYDKYKKYAKKLKDLDMPSVVFVEDGSVEAENKLNLQATDNQFTVSIEDNQQNVIMINNEGLIMN